MNCLMLSGMAFIVLVKILEKKWTEAVSQKIL